MKKISLFETVEVANKVYFKGYRLKYIQVVPFFDVFDDPSFEKEVKGTKYTLLEFYYDEESDNAFTVSEYYANDMKDMKKYVNKNYSFVY